MVSQQLPEIFTASPQSSRGGIDLFCLVLAFGKEVRRHDVPFTEDHLENVDSGQKLGCANHRNIIWVPAKPSVILATDFRINTEDLIGKEADLAGRSVLQRSDGQLSSLESLDLHGFWEHLSQLKNISLVLEILVDGTENCYPVHIEPHRQHLHGQAWVFFDHGLELIQEVLVSLLNFGSILLLSFGS